MFGRGGRASLSRVSQMKRGGHPVSRGIVRIIRENSKLEGSQPLAEHLQAVEARQACAIEFYLRACAMRLSQGGT